jgi:hypothetical protein
METHVMRETPELIVKFWPPSVTANGSDAIRAIRRPLAFVIYMRPLVLIAVAWLWPGEQAITWMKRLLGF